LRWGIQAARRDLCGDLERRDLTLKASPPAEAFRSSPGELLARDAPRRLGVADGDANISQSNVC